MMLVTGATGQLGAAVVRRLLQRTDPADVAVLVRDETKAVDLASRGVDVRVADYDDIPALDRALGGVDRVLLIAGNDPERRVQQHQNVIDVAVRARVDLIGFASRSLRNIEASHNTLMGDYFQTEDGIRSSGLPHVLFRNALYLDTVPLYVGGQRVFETGIRLPAGHGKVAYALRRELGEALANGMLDHAGSDRTHVLAASRAYSFGDLAAALTAIAGRTVDYVPISDDDYIARTVRGGVPEHLARRFLGFFFDIRDNQLDETGSDLQTLLGREPATLQQGCAELFGL
ncbi:MAG: NmrA family NAD(P)-binding protein [Pseudonocardiales bacterium]